MSYLGQDNDDFDFALENDVSVEVPWWKQLWAGTKEVLTTGAEVFQKVAPAIFDKPTWDPTYPIPTARIPTVRVEIDPRTGRERTVTDRVYVPGQPLRSGETIFVLPTGQRVIRKTTGAGVMPEWGMPLLLLGGGFLLMNVMGKRSKRK